MFVPTSTPRGSAPTSSQSPITAAVVKFRCLYTHDLRRKSKRWQDGYLKYHAFNKRVMVYDEHGNYIGDHHWRSTDEVQDGDELELDKGVLIEVGERMGTTQQDLTNLFEKRKSSQNSPPSNNLSRPNHSQPRPTPTPISTPASTLGRPSGSQSFRSLNDLLGIKRTPVGYTPSPYEERHPPSPSLPDTSERAPKRPRVSTGVIPNQSRNVQSEVVDLTKLEPQQVVRPPSPAASVARRETKKLSKDARPKAVSAEKPQNAQQPQETPSIPNAPKQDPPSFARPPLPPPSETKSRPKPVPAISKEPPVDSLTTRTKPTNTNDPPNNDSLRNSRNSRPNTDTLLPEQPVKTLRMATEKPRRKLMYSALLPSDTSQKSSPSPATSLPQKASNSAPKQKFKESQPASAPSQAPASTNMEFLPSVSTQSILNDMVDNPGLANGQTRGPHLSSKGSQPPPARNLPAKRSLDAPLRKSLSDPTALTARPGFQTRPTLIRSALSATNEQAEEVEEGPWTSEALDLFDFWPPGRPKPG